MPLDGRYMQSDVRRVLKVALNESAEKTYVAGTDATAYYYTENTLVLSPSTDTDKKQLMTIEAAFNSIAAISNKESYNKIIIPVAEEQKILGLFPRNHWVTLHYDVKTNHATLLDSRPWLMSFLYPTSAMKKSLKAGLVKVFDSKKIDNMSFDILYQGVQHNDTYCGAWTTTNIVDLAKNNCSVNDQKSAYTPSDEAIVIQRNQNVVASQQWQVFVKPIKPGLFQRILIFLGLMTAEAGIAPASAPPNEPKLSSHSKMKRNFKDPSSAQPSYSKIGDRYEPNVPVKTTNSKPIPQQPTEVDTPNQDSIVSSNQKH